MTRVVNAFREQTGARLIRNSAASNPMWDALDTGENDPAFSGVTIYVVHDPAGGRVLLTSRKGDPLIADDEGLYWAFQPAHGYPNFQRAYWSLVKRYGPNVYLSLVAGDDKTLPNDFDQIDTALRTLVP